METKKQALAESLRLKFKAEAVKACEASHQNGYFEGSASMDAYISTLRGYCEEIEGQIAILSPKDSSLRTSLVKALMERVYELLREEFAGNREEVLAIKQALLGSSKSLIPVVEAALPLEVYRTYALARAHEDLCLGRPYNLSVETEPPPLPLRISVELPQMIPRTDEKPYVSYEISVQIRLFSRKIPQDKEAAMIFSQERRYSDFCSLLDNLRKLFPLSTIPNLPPKQLVGDKSKEMLLLEPRRRQLKRWLQYIVMHPLLQISMPLLTFLGGSETQMTNLLAQISPDMTLRTSLAQNEILVGEKEEELDEKDNTEKILVGSTNSYSSKQRTFAKRLIATVCRDMSQFEPHACSATAACANLTTLIEKLDSTLAILGSNFNALNETDSCMLSKQLWNIFASNIPQILQIDMAQNSISINTIHDASNILLESLMFFNGSCLQSSSGNIEKIKSLSTTGDRRVESANVISKEWHILRHTRHKLFLGSLISVASMFKKEHNRISKCWRGALKSIEEIEIYITSTDATSAIKRSSIVDKSDEGIVIETVKPADKPKLTPPSSSSTGTMRWLSNALSSTLGFCSTSNRSESASPVAPSPPASAAPIDPVSDHEDEDEFVDAHEEDADAKVPKIVKPKKATVRRLGHKKGALSNDLDTEVLVEGLKGPATQPQSISRGKVGTDSYLSSFAADEMTIKREQQGPQKHDIPANIIEKVATPHSEVSSTKPDERLSGVRRTSFQESVSKTACRADDEIDSWQSDTEPSSSIHKISLDERKDQNISLAEGWEEVKAPTGEIYYYHKKTRVSRWDRPEAHIMEAVEARLQESQKIVEEAVQRRKLERDTEKKLLDEKNAAMEQEQANVKKVIISWSILPSSRSRSIQDLLNSLHTVLPNIVPADLNTLSEASTPSDVKKAYMKAVRYIHPDKLPHDLDMKSKILAEAVFVRLTEVFDLYRG